MRNFIRGFVAIWYLLGWISHVYLGIANPQIYAAFGKTALIPGYAELWQNFVMPNITLFALLLAAFEIVVGLLLINKGKWVKYGLVLSVLFNLFLIQMGLGVAEATGIEHFLLNRAANLVFLAIQIPLFWGTDEKTLIESIRYRLAARKVS